MKVCLTQLRNYTDDNGNSVEADPSSSMQGGSIVFHDKNALVRIGKNVDLRYCKIVLGSNSICEIGDNSRLSGLLSLGWNSSFRTPGKLTVTKNLRVRAVEGTAVLVGLDCLFASDVFIRTNDGHPIYDAVTRRRVNPSKSVMIGDHVWIGDDALVLKGVTIGQASIIGARSVVTKDVPPNSVAVGTPARIIRRNVTWEHNIGTVTEEFYLPLEVVE